ncbi:GAF domain-containing protein [Polyangium jinanense]|uniref:GAF domain-containing protein n=1 Tax=Polyangium jinanense TaxID=2829994 RepID=A0A9X4AWL8_9BACT|nr:GAF domain-containing protein [Polyangium jinanense]MDC3960816.1 GAF domain-containing protein [Polyangium jinanense]MDC3961019.1 GAF domain-containing protein [Polyangium jinanense]MDC3987439.1 GAF domain-containing protein [Polyangium jinanense]
MSDNEGRSKAPSEQPPEDLKRERDLFIQQFFRKGAQLTEEVLKENERLRERLSELESENGRLRSHIASDTAIRDLVRKIEALESEKNALLQRSVAMEAVSDRYTSRHQEVESELASLANLYVATSQLHSSTNVRHVLRNIKELLAQLLGAARFGVYIASDDKKELVAVATEGQSFADIATLPVDDGPIGRAYSTGKLYYDAENDVSKGTVERPAAVVPLLIDGQPIGVIAIFGTLSQKTAFDDQDGELFRLLGAQAALALVSARLFTDAGRKVPSVQAFLDLED